MGRSQGADFMGDKETSAMLDVTHGGTFPHVQYNAHKSEPYAERGPSREVRHTLDTHCSPLWIVFCFAFNFPFPNQPLIWQFLVAYN